MLKKFAFSEENGFPINYLVFPMFFLAAIALISTGIGLYREEAMNAKVLEVLGYNFDSILIWIGKGSFVLFFLWGLIGCYIFISRFKSTKEEG